MATVQLNVRVEAVLAAKLKAEAGKRHAKPGALVAQALERFLANAGMPSAAIASASNDWQAPLAKLEARVAALEVQKPSVLAQTGEALPKLQALPQRRLTSEEAASLVTGREICDELGLASESSLTNWISRNGHDQAIGKSFKGFRLMGKGLLPGGGKSGWLWQRTT